MSGEILKSATEDTKHEGDVTCVIYQNGNVFSSGADGKIKVWDADLNLKKTLNIHEAYIYAMAITPNGKLYSSSCDGTIKYLNNPLESDESKELVKCEMDEIECLVFENNSLYSGDDKGVVTLWENDRIVFKFNLIEQVKSLAVEDNRIYTVRDLDAVVTEVMPGKSGKYSTKATVPGRAPLALVGPIVDGRRSYLIFAARNGKGFTATKNLPMQQYATAWTMEDCHEMIIIAICGTDKEIFTAGWDGKVKKWINIDTSPKLASEVTIGKCINTLCNGPDGTVYCGSSDGIVRCLRF